MVPDRYALWVRLPLPLDVLLRVAPWIPEAGYVREECEDVYAVPSAVPPSASAYRGPVFLAKPGRSCRRHLDHGVESDPDHPGTMTGRVLGSRIGVAA